MTVPTGAGRRPAPARLAAIALTALVLASCGGGGGGGSAPSGAALSANYLPLDANDRWLYSSGGSGGTQALDAVVGTQAVSGQSAVVVQDTDLSTNASSQTLYVVKSDGIWQYPGAGASVFEQNLGAVQVMLLPLRVGNSFVQIDKTVDSGIDFDGDGRTDQIAVHSQVTVVGTDTINTPAGTFSNCLHQHTDATETVLYSSGAPSVTVTISADDWYAPDVGPVHGTSTAKSSKSSSSSLQDLVAYHTALKHSASPAVQSVAPSTTNTVRGYGLSVTATFSETMDAATLNQGGFTVVDANNQAVAGTVQVSGATALFVPTAGWVTGSYTASVSTGAQDLVGNAVAATRSWSFNVDATGPSLVSSTPAANAQDVPLNAQLVLQFSEPLDPTTVSTFSIQWTDPSGATVPSNLTIGGGGSTVTLVPTAPLQLRASYTVNISTTVSDLVGNPGNGALFVFRTEQGRFAAPAFLVPSVYFDAVAIGDVNADGLSDVVLTTDAANPANGQYSVSMLLGQTGGALGPLTGISGASALSSPGTVAIGDLNGDGREDIAVGVDYGGIQIYLQNADGSFSPGDFLNNAYTGRLRIADLNGDGRMDLVSVGGGGSVVNVWLQDATGHLVAQPSPSFAPNQGARDIEVGDVNGDGRPDLVVAISGYYPGQHVAVFLQQADGSFAAPIYLAADPTWGAWGVAIGDLNGDGRNDIVVTGGGNRPASNIYLYYQAANGTLGPAVPVSTYDIPLAVRVADIDGDGRKDVVVSHQGWSAVGVYLQQADGTLAPEQLFDAPYGNYNPQSMAVGDVNHDGLPDIIIDGQVLLQKPTGTYSPASILPAPARTFTRALDAGATRPPAFGR